MEVQVRFSRARTLAVYALDGEMARRMFENAASRVEPFAQLRDRQVKYFTCHIRGQAQLTVNYYPSTAAQYVCVVRVLERCEGRVANCHAPELGEGTVYKKIPILTLRPATDDDKNHPPLRRERLIRIIRAAGACDEGAADAVDKFWRESNEQD